MDLGYEDIRCVDVKPLDQWHQVHAEVENVVSDLSTPEAAREAVHGSQHVFNLAADMGGMGFIEANKALCMLSVLINTNLIQAARHERVERFFFASSACVYRADRQATTTEEALREEDAYPAMPEDGYGWEKLFSERMVRHFDEDFGVKGRIARYHNVYGPYGTWEGGREKAPAAICRKVATAVETGDMSIEIWGDGEQTRSFTYIDDTVEGTMRLMWSEVRQPLNVGSDEMVTINSLVAMVEDIAGVKLERRHILNAPLGVRGRNSDNSLIKKELGWAPSIPLHEGLKPTYAWILEEIQQARTSKN